MDEFEVLTKQLLASVDSELKVQKKKLEKETYYDGVREGDRADYKSLKQDVEDHLPDKRYSVIESTAVRHNVSKEIKKERKLKKKRGFIEKNFESKAYFKRLFPPVKEQKPG
jgi:hypothetical protein